MRWQMCKTTFPIILCGSTSMIKYIDKTSVRNIFALHFVQSISKFGVRFFFWKNVIVLFIKDVLNGSKVTVNTFIMLQRHHLKNALLLKNPETNVSCFHKNKKQNKNTVFLTLIIIINYFWRIMWHWRLSNDAEKSALHHGNKIYLKTH